jgi:recombination protein RecA
MAPKKPAPVKVSALSRARKALTSVLKEDHVVPLSDDLLKESIPHIPTGSIIVDYAIGGKVNKYGVAPCPGIPRGRITQLYGMNSAGKTTLALTICAAVCAAGGTCAYIDWEHEVEPRYAAALGVPISDPDRFILLQPNTLEEGMKAMILFIQEGVELIVLDSVGAGIPEILWNRTADEEGNQTRPGLVAAKWSEFLPKVKSAMKTSGTTILAISQMRKTISAMSGGGPDSAPQGGEAWKFYTSVRMMLRVLQKEKAKQFDALTGKMEDRVVGSIVILKLEKCKVSDAVNNEFRFYLRSGHGIDNARSVVDLAIAYKIITKGGAWYEWSTAPGGSSLRCNGMEALLRKFREDTKLLPVLFSQVAPKLMASNAMNVASEEEEAEGELSTDDVEELFAVVDGVKKTIAQVEAVGGSLKDALEGVDEPD